jgi:hypothetical protein
MELFRRNSKVERFVIIKGGGIHAYLSSSIDATQKQLMGIALILEEMLGKCRYVIDPTH